jgi:hypothetical protein
MLLHEREDALSTDIASSWCYELTLGSALVVAIEHGQVHIQIVFKRFAAGFCTRRILVSNREQPQTDLLPIGMLYIQVEVRVGIYHSIEKLERGRAGD